jgi:hypothetical protein
MYILDETTMNIVTKGKGKNCVSDFAFFAKKDTLRFNLMIALSDVYKYLRCISSSG